MTADGDPWPADAERLYDVAHARSGDKGDIANIGVIPYDPGLYPVLEEQLTTERVKAHFGGLVTGEVERYCVPGLDCMNFVLHGALDGGPTRTLRIDKKGKTLSGHMLRYELR